MRGFPAPRPEQRSGVAASSCRGPTDLVDVHRGDQHGADGDLLPERLDADDDEAVLQDGRDEEADHGAEDRADATEQRGAADHDRRDDVQVGLRLARDRRGAELRQRQHTGETGEQPRQRVDLDQVRVDADADPTGRLLVGADGVGVATEAGEVQQHHPEQDDHEGDHRQHRDLPEDVAVADLGLHHQRHGADVHALGEDLREPERHAERAQRDDQRRDLRLGDQEAVEDAPAEAGHDRGDDAEERRPPPVTADLDHQLRGDHAGEDHHRADREVDAGGDDDEGHADAEDREDRGVLGDQPGVAQRGERVRRHHREHDDDADQHQQDLEGLHPDHPLVDAQVLRLGTDSIGARGCAGRGHAAAPPTAPVMAPTSSSIDVADVS